jgi:hypothetical protein
MAVPIKTCDAINDQRRPMVSASAPGRHLANEPGGRLGNADDYELHTRKMRVENQVDAGDQPPAAM